MISFKNFFKNLFLYKEPKNDYNFILPSSLDPNDTPKSIYSKNIDFLPNHDIFQTFDDNLTYIKSKYNTLINSDIILREFDLNVNGKKYKSFLLFIDGMVKSELINNFTLRPLMEKKTKSNKINIKNVSVNFNLENYIFNSLIPQNSIEKVKDFDTISSFVNTGCCALFVDTISIAFVIDVKGFASRNISTPNNEIVVRGSQEAFVEKLRTNTSMLRRIINNEDLIIEKTSVGNISKTSVAICYMKSIANNELISEVKYRINNLDIDYIVSSRSIRTIYTR